jgi:hypothetical protein
MTATTTTTDLQGQIIDAYWDLTSGAGEFVSLTRILRVVGPVEHADFNEAVRLLNRRPDVNVVPESNQKILTAEDRAAAVVIGDQAKHHVAMW